MLSVVVLALVATRDIRMAMADARADTWRRLLSVAVISAVEALAAYVFVLARVQNTGPRSWLPRLISCLSRVAWSRSPPWPIVSGGESGCLRHSVGLALVDAVALTTGLGRPTMYTTATRPRWDRINAEHRPELTVYDGLTLRRAAARMALLPGEQPQHPAEDRDVRQLHDDDESIPDRVRE